MYSNKENCSSVLVKLTEDCFLEIPNSYELLLYQSVLNKNIKEFLSCNFNTAALLENLKKKNLTQPTSHS